MIKINDGLLDGVVKKAKSSARKRMNHNFHRESTDTLQRLLNCIEPGSYVRPHKHDTPDKREVFIALKGKFVVVEFDNLGNITDKTIINSKTGIYGVEIAQKTWHTIISLESGSVVYEFKDGPYEPIEDKNFAPWAPEEGSKEASGYLEQLIKKLRI